MKAETISPAIEKKLLEIGTKKILLLNEEILVAGDKIFYLKKGIVKMTQVAYSKKFLLNFFSSGSFIFDITTNNAKKKW